MSDTSTRVRRKRMAIKVLFFVVAVYAGVFLGLALMQRSFMYHPEADNEKDLLALAPQAKLLPWRDESGVLGLSSAAEKGCGREKAKGDCIKNQQPGNALPSPRAIEEDMRTFSHNSL